MVLERVMEDEIKSIKMDFSTSIYDFSKNHVAKVVSPIKILKRWNDPMPITKHFGNTKYYQFGLHNKLDVLNHELFITEEAYNNGLNVPKPEGVCFLKPSKESSLLSKLFHGNEVPALIMEKLRGIYFHEIDDPEEYREATRQISDQVYEARNMGFFPKDYDHEENRLWDPEKRKSYFVDLELWTYNENSITKTHKNNFFYAET